MAMALDNAHALVVEEPGIRILLLRAGDSIRSGRLEDHHAYDTERRVDVFLCGDERWEILLLHGLQGIEAGIQALVGIGCC